MSGTSGNGAAGGLPTVPRTNSLPGMARTKATLTRAASTEELGTAAQVSCCNM